MSKRCRYILLEKLNFCLIYLHTSNASLIIVGSKQLSKQSTIWFMATPKTHSYPKHYISLGRLLHLLCPLYSFVTQMSTNLLRFIKNYSMNFEQSERSMEQNENIILKMSNYVTYLWTGLGLANSFQLLCPQYLIVPLQTTKIICSDFSEKLMSK